MARLARQPSVTALQSKDGPVVKIRQDFTALVAGNAGRAICSDMLLCERGIYASMTRGAHGPLKAIVWHVVTVCADKRLTTCAV
jgi:hypothetical protein